MSYRGLGTENPKVAAAAGDPKAPPSSPSADSARRDFWRQMGITAVTNLPGTIQALRNDGGQAPLPGADVAPYPQPVEVTPPPDNTLLVAGVVGGVVLLGLLAVMSRRR